MSFEHANSHPDGTLTPPETPQETTLEIEAITEGILATPSHTPLPADIILPQRRLNCESANDDPRYSERAPLFPGWAKKGAAAVLGIAALVGIGVGIGATIADKKPAVSAPYTPPIPESSSSASPTESDTPTPTASTTASASSSASESATPTASPSASASKTASSLPTPAQSVVISPIPTHTKTASPSPTPRTTPPSQECSWPMDAQGDSEVRSTCANGAAMEAYNEPSANSGESFAIYPGLYVHDVSQSGQYTKVSIGSGANASYGYILSKLIGNPYGG